jgi:hypothetical protein
MTNARNANAKKSKKLRHHHLHMVLWNSYDHNNHDYEHNNYLAIYNRRCPSLSLGRSCEEGGIASLQF